MKSSPGSEAPVRHGFLWPAILAAKYGANSHPEPIVLVMTAITMLNSVRFRFNEEGEGVSAAIPGPGHQWFREQVVIACDVCPG